jgi:hypothetical protein
MLPTLQKNPPDASVNAPSHDFNSRATQAFDLADPDFSHGLIYPIGDHSVVESYDLQPAPLVILLLKVAPHMRHALDALHPSPNLGGFIRVSLNHEFQRRPGNTA